MDKDVTNNQTEIPRPQNPFITKLFVAIVITAVLVLLATIGQLQSIENSKNQTAISATPRMQQAKEPKPYLGVEYIMLDKDEPDLQRTIGAYITHIVKDSPAEKTQLQSSNDTIIDIDGEKISPETKTLGEALATKKPGQTIRITYNRYTCDPRDKTFLSCRLFIKNVATASATLIQMPIPDTYPYFTLLQQIPSLTKSVQWESARPDDYWDSDNILTVPGFSIRGLLTSPDASLEPVFPVLGPLIKEMGWLQNGATEPFFKKESGMQQVLTYRIYDETNKADPTTQKTGRRCPCTISYYIFISFPYASTVTPTLYNRISPTGF